MTDTYSTHMCKMKRGWGVEKFSATAIIRGWVKKIDLREDGLKIKVCMLIKDRTTLENASGFID